MTSAPVKRSLDARVRDALLSPSLRMHLFIVGAALAVGALMSLWLFGDVSFWRVAGAMAIVTHLGIIMMFGAATLRWAARHLFDR